tara:strand:- start:64184 stop:64351 length:168 start_codon:yes stop_codon:yes gene_type:complete
LVGHGQHRSRERNGKGTHGLSSQATGTGIAEQDEGHTAQLPQALLQLADTMQQKK